MISKLEQRVERQILHSSDTRYDTLIAACHVSKDLYNQANYIVRQKFIKEGIYIEQYDLDKLVRELAEHQNYQILPNNTSQQILMVLSQNWRSYFAAHKDWEKNPDKYEGEPRIPKYMKKDGVNLLVFTSVQVRIRNGVIKLPKKLGRLQLKTNVTTLQQLRIIPKLNHIMIEVVYRVDVPEPKPDNQRYAGIDLGLDNFATITDNLGNQPVIINGKGLKSINHFWNKRLAHFSNIADRLGQDKSTKFIRQITMRRNFKVQDFMHKASRFVVNYCLEHDINTLIVGHNQGQKQGINIGHVNNQNFVQVPYGSFLRKLEYKCRDAGINLIITEESYTSKSSFFDNDPLPEFGKSKLSGTQFTGKRVTRGTYQTNSGTKVNADVNASFNIMRKVIRDPALLAVDIGCILHPRKVAVSTKPDGDFQNNPYYDRGFV